VAASVGRTGGRRVLVLAARLDLTRPNQSRRSRSSAPSPNPWTGAGRCRTSARTGSVRPFAGLRLRVAMVPRGFGRGRHGHHLRRMVLRGACRTDRQFRYETWIVRYMAEGREGQPSVGVWLSAVMLAAVAGLLFGLAISLPFGRVRYAWSRLLLAAVAAAPIADFWWSYLRTGQVASGWVAGSRLVAQPHVQFALAALAGVALGAGIGVRRSAE
jgi:hypothetical protein